MLTQTSMSVNAPFFEVFGTLEIGTAARPNRLKFAAVRKSANDAAALTGRTHGCTDQPADVKKSLANSEPSTHGTKRT